MGDRDTKFFFVCTLERRKKNHIRCISKELGDICETVDDIAPALKDCFSNLFMTSGHSHEEIDQIRAIEPRVTEAMNQQLNKNYTQLEIEWALKQMAHLKSLGPDGFGACFFQLHWCTVGDKVCNAILDILQGKGMYLALNSIHIALIPKKDNPELMSDFRPISLCNVIYKLVSKVIYNRLKTVMSLIISRTQSTFISGRLITDNIMVAYELLHSMKTHNK